MTTQRVALVTGAGSGIGQRVAQRLSAAAAVVACDIDALTAEATAAAIRADGGTAIALAFDVSNFDAVHAAAEAAVAEFGRIDVVVGAGGYAGFIDFLDMTEADWDRMLGVHAKGAFNLAHAALPSMKANGFGRLVYISSVAAMSGSPAHSHYAAAKAAIVGFVKALCREVGPWGVTVNAIAPGVIDTPMLAEASEESRARLAGNPVGRLGETDDIAEAVAYLASDGAGFVTGTVMHVNGGSYT
jgi:NAD(P)-dependent dehydrogenase (short-subunit alcohol dehydrogenase family)